MRQLRIGDITIDAVIEREGPWRAAAGFFSRPMTRPVFKRHLPTMEPEVFDYSARNDGDHLSDFRGPNAALHDPGRHLQPASHKGHPPAVRFSGQGALAQTSCFALGI